MDDSQDRPVVIASSTERGEHVRTLMQHCEVVFSTKPEERGVDFLWSARGAWFGVQRKTIQDFWASELDGRLAKELGQMTDGFQTDPWMIVEGKLSATIEGMFNPTGRGRAISVKSHYKALNSIAERGVRVVQTDTAQHTGFAIAGLVSGSQSETHSIGVNRPKPAGVWGTKTSREWAVHLLQSFDGVGPELAKKIIDRFDGPPLEWSCTVDELAEVEGLGRVKVTKLMNALNRKVT